jgi:hypothetical protein
MRLLAPHKERISRDQQGAQEACAGVLQRYVAPTQLLRATSYTIKKRLQARGISNGIKALWSLAQPMVQK